MAAATKSTTMALLLLLFIISLLSSFNKGYAINTVNKDQEQKTWCVAKPSSSDAELSANLDFACASDRDCSAIHQGGSCYDPPNSLLNRASVAMNIYYQSQGRNYWNCDFLKSALITITNPSYGNCKYV